MSVSRPSPTASAVADDGVRLGVEKSGGDLGDLAEVIEHAAHLLPQQGPITVYVHHNPLHAFEDLPFDEAIREGAQIFGCQPYLHEDRYRDGGCRVGADSIPAGFQEVVEEDLGERAAGAVPGFGTRMDLRLAMLQYPLRIGPSEARHGSGTSLAEQDALRRVRPEASSAIRARLIAETRRWVMRDLRGGTEEAQPMARWNGRPGDRRAGESRGELLVRFGESAIETWSDDDLGAVPAPRRLARVCCDGVRDLPPFTAATARAPLRHLDLLLEATGEDADTWWSGC